MIDTVLIAISFPGEPVALMQFVTDDGKNIIRDATPEAIEAEIERNWPGKSRAWRVAHVSEVPEDRTYRSAWVDGKKGIDVSMQLARDIHRDRMRAARAKLMAALDADYMRADEADDKAAKAAIAKRKQELRDVTKLDGIEAAKTPAALRMVWPAALGPAE